MDESEDNIGSESWTKVDTNLNVKVKPKKRSLVERELETNLTARVTSPLTLGDATTTSRYGRALRLKTESPLRDSRKGTLDVVKTTPPEKSPNKVQSPVYKMHASNSPIRTVSPKIVPIVETFLENQIETIYQENISLSRFSSDEINKNSPSNNQKIYMQKDLIQSREPEEPLVLIKNLFSPVKVSNDKTTNTHLNNILERSPSKFNVNNKNNSENSYGGNSSVVKTLDFDNNKKKKKENKESKFVSNNDMFDLEAKCMFQVGDLAWSRMGSYPFWPCIVTRDPITGIFVKKKLFGRIERDIIHVTFFGDNGRRGWILDSMLRKFTGLAEFETTRDRFTAEDKKKDPRLYAAFFISEKKQALWHISVEEAETLLREPKRLRVDLLNDVLENSITYKINPKTQKSSKVTRTDSDVSLSESLFDTLFSEEDLKTDDSERSKHKFRNKSLDVSEVVTACLDNMAAKTGITKIQRQSHMDRWLQKAKSKTPEKTHFKTQVSKVKDNKLSLSKKKRLHRDAKPYNLRKSQFESHTLLAYHNEHDYSKFVSDDDNSSVKTNISDGIVENKHDFVPSKDTRDSIGVRTRTKSLGDNTEYNNKVHTSKNYGANATSNKYDNEQEVKNESIITKKERHISLGHVNEVIKDQNKEENMNKEDVVDKQINGCIMLKDNKKSCPDTITIELDCLFTNNSQLETSGSQSVNEVYDAYNKNHMKTDKINDKEITNMSAFLAKDNLLTDNINFSVIDSEICSPNTNLNTAVNEQNVCSEKSNNISINHVNFRKDTLNDSVVANVRIEKETASDRGDNNITVDVNLLQKNNCDNVNINPSDFFLCKTENTFLHSIKSTNEDIFDDTNNISVNNFVDELKLITSSDSNILSQENFSVKGKTNDNNDILNQIEIVTPVLNIQSNLFEAEKLKDCLQTVQGLGKGTSNIDHENKGEADSIVSVIKKKNNKNSLKTSEFCDNKNIPLANNATSNSNSTMQFMDSDIDTFVKTGILNDAFYTEKLETHVEEAVNINGYQDNDIEKRILNQSNETADIPLTKSDNEISGNVSNLFNADYKHKIKLDTRESIKIINIENNDNIDSTSINSKESDVINIKEKHRLRSINNQITNGTNNPEFLKYYKLRQDTVMDEYPELNEHEILTYLYQTWLYEYNKKSDIEKANDLQNASSVKGLDEPIINKLSYRPKEVNTTNLQKKSRKLKSENIPFNSPVNVKSNLGLKNAFGLVKKSLSLKRNNAIEHSPKEELSVTKINNVSVNSCATDKRSENGIIKKNNDFTDESVDQNIQNQESESECISGDSKNNDELCPKPHVSKVTGLIDDDLYQETASVDSKTCNLNLYSQKLRKEGKENVTNKIIEIEAITEPSKSNEITSSIGLKEPMLTNSEETLCNNSQIVNSLHGGLDKEELDNDDNDVTADSESSGFDETKQGEFVALDVSLEANNEEAESINDSFQSLDSKASSAKTEEKSKRCRKIGSLDNSFESNEAESENNESFNSIDSETSITKPTQKTKYNKKTNDRLDDPEFRMYRERREDAVMEENPQLTEDEVINYLYKTWLYEENSKTELEKTDIIAQTSLIKGLDQEIVPPKRTKKKVKVATEITDYFDISPKEKPKRKSIKPFYNEEYYDIDDEIENDGGSIECGRRSTLETNVGDAEQAVEGEEDIDDAEVYFSDLIKPKPNIYKGLIREKVCEICEITGNLVKCKTCHGMFHVSCVQSETKSAEVSTPARGRRKKKKSGRKPKNPEDSEGNNSDDRQDITEENNLSIEDVEMELITVDAETLETHLYEKMKEIMKDSRNFKYDSYSSDNETDWSKTIAGKCEIVDVKLNRKSTDPNHIDYSDFKCKSCTKYDTPVCFVCKSDVSKNQSTMRQRCQIPHCNKYYHSECLDHWPQTHFNAGRLSKSNKVNVHFEALSCPRHVCHTCVSDDPRGCKTRFSGDKLAYCIRCPATYHSFNKCTPAGSQILTASQIICPRHYKHRPGKVPCHVNTGWCFICALGGSLICCEYCPTSFHAECLNIDPPEGGYMCEDCETGRLPLYGEMVWVKLGHFRWWPGLILHPSEIPNNIMAVKHSPGEFVVRFFGQYDYYWVNRGRVFPFQEGDTGRVSSQRSKIDAAFTTAIEHAQRACQVLKSAMPNEEESLDIASSLLPPHYVKLKVNKPCGSLCGRKPDDPELSLTQCECNPDEEDPCGPYSQCLNRMLVTECGPSCRAGDRCNNRAFEKRLYPKLVPYRTPHRGWGLKTLEDIKAGQFVIEYVGELIDEEEFKRRMQRKHEIRDENFYFLTLDKERMIDAGPKGNLARFMNHCCEPNCDTQKWTVLGDVRVGLFALKDIPANSEVTFNYNLESAGIEKKRCMCGAKRCAGYIGAKPKQDEPQAKKAKVPVKRTYKKRKVEESPSISKTKTKRLGRPPKPKELTEIEKDLMIIRNATSGLSSDESNVSLSSEGDRLPKALKRKRVNFSTEDTAVLELPETSNSKRQKFDEKEVAD